MRSKTWQFVFNLLLALAVLSGTAAAKKGDKGRPKEEITGSQRMVLWQEPTDIRARDLFYGPGGKDNAPPATFTFIKEDLDGTNPKFDVRDESGVKWKVKMGLEARPEVVATRLVWAVGYFANEDYFEPEIHVENLPDHLHRGQNFVTAGGIVHNVRLKRYLKGEKKTGPWSWRANPFAGSRELNGLRVMMALIDNWDLKDENNSIYEEKPRSKSGPSESVYMVSDLGASFGAPHRSAPRTKGKDNLDAFRNAKFMTKETGEYVNFSTPGLPSLPLIFNLTDFVSRARLRWIGHRVPRADARWMGQLLAQLSPNQIRDAFRAAGYSPDEVEGFSKVVEKRIEELKNL